MTSKFCAFYCRLNRLHKSDATLKFVPKGGNRLELVTFRVASSSQQRKSDGHFVWATLKNKTFGNKLAAFSFSSSFTFSFVCLLQAKSIIAVRKAFCVRRELQRGDSEKWWWLMALNGLWKKISDSIWKARKMNERNISGFLERVSQKQFFYGDHPIIRRNRRRDAKFVLKQKPRKWGQKKSNDWLHC